MSYHSSIWKYLSVFNEMVREMLNQPPSSQKKVYNYYRIVIIAFAIVSYILSILVGNFFVCIIGTALGTIVAYALFVPSWPRWRQSNQYRFQPKGPIAQQEESLSA